MSILNVRVQPDRALVLVDTRGFMAEDPGTGFECSKILPLVHADTIFAARGQVALMWSLWSRFYLDRDMHFDAIVAGMLGTLKPILLETKRTAPHVLQAGAHLGGSVLELFVVGRSREAGGRLRAMHWAVDTKGDVLGPVEAEGYVSPLRDAAAKPTTLPDSIGGWVSLVREQVADWRRILPGVPIGGSLIAAELSDLGMQIRNIGQI